MMIRYALLAPTLMALVAATVAAQQPAPLPGYGTECDCCNQWGGVLPNVRNALASHVPSPGPAAYGLCSYGTCQPCSCQKGCCQKGCCQKGCCVQKPCLQKGCCQKAAIAPKCCAPVCHAPKGCLQRPFCCQKAIAPKCHAPLAGKCGGHGHGILGSRGLLHAFGFFGHRGHCCCDYCAGGGYAPMGPTVNEIPQPNMGEPNPFQDDPVRPTSYTAGRPRGLYYR